MSSQNWQDWSLADLKQLAADTRPTMLRDSIDHFDQTASHLNTVQHTFMAHLRALGDAWQGKAATAAINNAQTTYETMDSTRSMSASAGEQTVSYQTQLASHQQQAKAVPDVDTSWGHAASSGGWAGAIGIGVAKYEQQKKYDENRDRLAKIVAQMDDGGNEQAAAMSGSSWPARSTMIDTPPASLPPVPGATKPTGPAGPANPNPGSGPGTNPGGPGYPPVGVGTPSHPGDGNVLHGTKGHHPPGGTTTTTPGGTQIPGDPTVTQGAGGTPGDPGTVADGTPVTAPPVPGAPAGAGAAAAVLGGAGLLGAGAAGGRGLLGGTGVRSGAGTAGDPEGRLAAKGGRGLGESEGGGVRSGSGGAGRVGADDGGPRAGGRGVSGIPADDELGAGRGGGLRGAGTGGFGGEPVAAEAGRTGGYPMGGGGRRRGEDEEAPMPDYLVETDDVWGDGASAAPPVIGE